jgi:uncharacterized protein YeaO (DUF488 family)
MALQTKCILDPRNSNDGLRISIVNKNKSNDRETAGLFDLIYIALAPSRNLMELLNKNLVTWEKFEKKFKKELNRSIQQIRIKELSDLALQGNVTILSLEDTTKSSYVRIVAEQCKQLKPELFVRHY